MEFEGAADRHRQCARLPGSLEHFARRFAFDAGCWALFSAPFQSDFNPTDHASLRYSRDRDITVAVASPDASSNRSKGSAWKAK